MFKLDKFSNFKKGFFIVPLTVILILILFSYIIKWYFHDTISSSWQQVSDEKSAEVTEKCLSSFYSRQNELSDITSKLSIEKRLINALETGNISKAYDIFFEKLDGTNHNIEIYNPLFEMVLFKGRQLHPEILELKKTLEAEKFSVVKELGLYTLLIVYEPLKNESGKIIGIIAAGSVIDVNSNIQNVYFDNTGITNEIYNKYHINVEFSYKKEDLGLKQNEQQYIIQNLEGIDGSKVGSVYIPRLDKDSYISSINIKFFNLISFLIFIFSIITVYWIFIYVKSLNSYILTVPVIVALLILARYLWLYIDFPSNFFSDLEIEFFSPNFYASGFGYGVAKSLGDLLITAVAVFLCSFNIISGTISFHKKEIKVKKNIILTLFISLLSIISIFISLYIFGEILQSLIYDSSIKFIDKSELFSVSQPELLFARIILLLLSSSLIFIIISCCLLVIKYLSPFIHGYKIIRKYSSIFITALLVCIVPLIAVTDLNISLSSTHMILIFLLSGIILFYLQRKIHLSRNYRFVNLTVISLILLAITIFIPLLILNKITSQENHYLERAAREISQSNIEKVSFLVNSTLNEIAMNGDIVYEIKDPNKISNIAFTLWSSSSLNDEDVNSAIFILDTNMKPISDFGTFTSELNKDSIIKFVTGKYNSRNIIQDEEAADLRRDTSMFLSDAGYFASSEPGLINNSESKFFAAVTEIGGAEDTDSEFEKPAAYAIVVCSYDSKNYMRQINPGLFRNIARDNIINKLTSPPVFSEFSFDELTGSSNSDVSKTLLKSLPAFRESIKDKPVKASLRYDQFENESYKSFYVLTEGGKNIPEKIYVVSIKINDFALTSFFFFRYLLFTAFIFLIILTGYLLYRASTVLIKWQRLRIVTFGFREKLFISFLIASVVPIIILALYTREYVKSKNEESYKNQLISDLRLVEQYVKNRMQLITLSEKDGKKHNESSFKDVFGKELSQTNKNFNLYFNNKLEATTNEQLYKSGLLDSRLSGKAYYNIALLKKDFYNENQQIGDFTYIVGYKPVFDRYNYLTGIISSQTVFKQTEMNQELTESLVYIFGPYIAAVIMLVFLVNVLSYRISNPILKLQKATERLSKGLTDVEVKSKTKDEIGELVKSFNRMVKELRRAQEELKIAERETAWRDIARQVAHEIKNPLTPMMLAMQHLYRTYSSGSKNFDKIIKTTHKLIIDQIETLNKIATEFSSFARLPGKNYQILDADDIIKDVSGLMSTKQIIELKLSENKKHNISGDKDELKRALLNIIKNAIQAIEENKENNKNGKVIISSEQINGYYHIRVKDNGTGMDSNTLNKLFEPYFSTRSSGMGLGLVITKKILDEMKAKIYVKSEEGKGTEVEIVFKLAT